MAHSDSRAADSFVPLLHVPVGSAGRMNLRGDGVDGGDGLLVYSGREAAATSDVAEPVGDAAGVVAQHLVVAAGGNRAGTSLDELAQVVHVGVDRLPAADIPAGSAFPFSAQTASGAEQPGTGVVLMSVAPVEAASPATPRDSGSQPVIVQADSAPPVNLMIVASNHRPAAALPSAVHVLHGAGHSYARQIVVSSADSTVGTASSIAGTSSMHLAAPVVVHQSTATASTTGAAAAARFRPQVGGFRGVSGSAPAAAGFGHVNVTTDAEMASGIYARQIMSTTHSAVLSSSSSAGASAVRLRAPDVVRQSSAGAAASFGQQVGGNRSEAGSATPVVGHSSATLRAELTARGNYATPTVDSTVAPSSLGIGPSFVRRAASGSTRRSADAAAAATAVSSHPYVDGVRSTVRNAAPPAVVSQIPAAEGVNVGRQASARRDTAPVPRAEAPSAPPGIRPHQIRPHASSAATAKKSNRKTSVFKGVSMCFRNGKFHASISVGGKDRALGYHDDERSAAAAYDAACEDIGRPTCNDTTTQERASARLKFPKRRQTTSRHRGVSQGRDGRWKGCVWKARKLFDCGIHDTEAQAAVAVLQMRQFLTTLTAEDIATLKAQPGRHPRIRAPVFEPQPRVAQVHPPPTQPPARSLDHSTGAAGDPDPSLQARVPALLVRPPPDDVEDVAPSNKRTRV